MKKMTSFRSGTVAVAAVVALAGACGSDGKDDSATGTTGAAKTATVTATDYSFAGLPKDAAPGTKLVFKNDSTKEVHELVVYRLPDTEKRSVAELVKLPDSEFETIFRGPPATVLVAPPAGAPQIDAVGDGTLSQSGRYLAFCTIPTGADPAAYLAAAQAAGPGSPPASVPGGAPHFANGMFGEITVK